MAVVVQAPRGIQDVRLDPNFIGRPTRRQENHRPIKEENRSSARNNNNNYRRNNNDSKTNNNVITKKKDRRGKKSNKNHNAKRWAIWQGRLKEKRALQMEGYGWRDTGHGWGYRSGHQRRKF